MLFFEAEVNKKPSIFQELEINGQNVDDKGATADTGEPADAADPGNPGEEEAEDYTVPDEGEDEGNEDQNPDEQGEDTEEPTDYTEDNPDEGGEEGAPEGEEGGDAPQEDQGDEGSGDRTELQQQIGDMENDIFGELNDDQKNIRDKELKKNFIALDDIISSTIERINDISKNNDLLQPLEKLSSQLSALSDRVSDYLVYTYKTKEYTENLVNYNLFVNTLSQINEILSKLQPEHVN